MSELFGWLRQKDAGKAGKVAGIRPQLLDVQRVGGAAEPERSRPASPPVEVAEAEPEICCTVQFDLKAADHQVKQVLDPVTLYGEQFRRLRATLLLMQKQQSVKVLLVTSACPGEGKTFTACSLAGVLAQEPGSRVLLVDADLRKPRAGKQIGMKGDPDSVTGFSAVLRGEVGLMASIAGSTNGDLFFLPTGKVPPNPSELLTSPILEDAVKTARNVFDWVVIDAPPVLALSDAVVMAPVCDTILVVVQASVTPSKLVKEAIRRLGREKVCGILMNRVKLLKSPNYSRYYHDKGVG
jgi:protein-tyrosine kinase